jgi:hypothetical protein
MVECEMGGGAVRDVFVTHRHGQGRADIPDGVPVQDVYQVELVHGAGAVRRHQSRAPVIHGDRYGFTGIDVQHRFARARFADSEAHVRRPERSGARRLQQGFCAGRRRRMRRTWDDDGYEERCKCEPNPPSCGLPHPHSVHHHDSRETEQFAPSPGRRLSTNVSASRARSAHVVEANRAVTKTSGALYSTEFSLEAYACSWSA